MSAVDICQRLALVNERIDKAAKLSGRQFSEIKLVAVSKTKSIDQILDAHLAGVTIFGENYAQEMYSKIEILRSMDKVLDFHFIGHLQSNKIKLMSDDVRCIQTVDSLSLGKKLNQYIASKGLKPLSILVQVNISNEPQKNGIYPTELEEFLTALNNFSNLNVNGLMTIGSYSENIEDRRKEFALLRRLRDKLELQGFQLPDLSMGMSDDFEYAIAEGATVVRVGSAIFGDRS